jgi:hypothetical protein
MDDAVARGRTTAEDDDAVAGADRGGRRRRVTP